jgi:hypothetical protein
MKYDELRVGLRVRLVREVEGVKWGEAGTIWLVLPLPVVVDLDGDGLVYCEPADLQPLPGDERQVEAPQGG